MASRIEQIIDEIEEYIDGCKYQTLSSSKIIVNKDELEELLNELRSKTPEEIKRYQKIISNQEAILADAKAKADAIIAKAQVKTDELLGNLELSISHAMDSARARHDNYMSSLQEFYDIVSSNRAELNPPAEEAAVSDNTENLPKIDITPDMLG